MILQRKRRVAGHRHMLGFGWRRLPLSIRSRRTGGRSARLTSPVWRLRSPGAKRLIESLYFIDTAPTATRDMTEVPGAERRELLMELARQGHILQFKRPDLDGGANHQRQRRIQRLQPPDRKIGMRQLLQNLRRRTQRSAVSIAFVEELTRRLAQRMGSTDRVHEHVRVNENHALGTPC